MDHCDPPIVSPSPDPPLSTDSIRSSGREPERMNRRLHDFSAYVSNNASYNTHFLAGSRVMPTHLDLSAGGGYHTGVRPRMLQQSSAFTAHPKSQPNPSSHISEQSLPKGWFNKRGDELVRPGTTILMPPDRQYPDHFKHHPDVGSGFMDSKGNIIDVNCRVIRRVG